MFYINYLLIALVLFRRSKIYYNLCFLNLWILIVSVILIMLLILICIICFRLWCMNILNVICLILIIVSMITLIIVLFCIVFDYSLHYCFDKYWIVLLMMILIFEVSSWLLYDIDYLDLSAIIPEQKLDFQRWRLCMKKALCPIDLLSLLFSTKIYV